MSTKHQHRLIFQKIRYSREKFNAEEASKLQTDLIDLVEVVNSEIKLLVAVNEVEVLFHRQLRLLQPASSSTTVSLRHFHHNLHFVLAHGPCASVRDFC